MPPIRLALRRSGAQVAVASARVPAPNARQTPFRCDGPFQEHVRRSPKDNPGCRQLQLRSARRLHPMPLDCARSIDSGLARHMQQQLHVHQIHGYGPSSAGHQMRQPARLTMHRRSAPPQIGWSVDFSLLPPHPERLPARTSAPRARPGPRPDRLPSLSRQAEFRRSERQAPDQYRQR